MSKRFKIIAETVNGVIKNTPIEVWAPCSHLRPIGEEVVRNYDANECIIAKRVYLVYYNGDVLGTAQFKTLDEFLQYRNSQCETTDNNCGVYMNGCQILIGGCSISIKS